MKKPIQLALCFALLSLLFFSCRKETALTTDRVPPKVTFRIQGGGSDNTFEATGAGMSPNGEYIFKENTRYSFTVTINDTSGLGNLVFKMTKGDHVADFSLNGAPAATEVASTIEHHYSIITERTDPFTSFVMTGNFLTGSSGGGQDIRFSIVGRDYLPNTTTINLNGSLYGNSPSGTFGWNPF